MSNLWPSAMLALLALLAALLFLSRRSTGWFSPAMLLTGVWSVAIALPLLFAPGYYVWPPGIWLIILVVLVFSLSSMAGERLGAVGLGAAEISNPTRVTTYPTIFNCDLRVLRLSVLVASAMGALAVEVLLAEAGKSPSELLTVEGWVQMGAQFYLAKYEVDYVEPLLARIFSIGIYLGALLGGTLLSVSQLRRDRFIALLPVAVALVYSTVMTTRAALMFTGAMIVSAFLASRMLADRGRPLMVSRRALLVYLPALGGAVFTVFVLLQTVRGGKQDLNDVGATVEHLRIWFCGHISGFTLWLRGYLHDETELRLGERTFAGLFQSLGLGERKTGIYDMIPIGQGLESNIFTMLRSLLEDFGLAGTLSVTPIGGVISGFLYGRVRSGSFKAVPFLAGAYCCALWSPIGSVFAYNTLLLSLLAYIAVFWLLTTTRVHRASVMA